MNICVQVSNMLNRDDAHDSGEANLGTLSQAIVDRILGLLAPGSSLSSDASYEGKFLELHAPA